MKILRCLALVWLLLGSVAPASPLPVRAAAPSVPEDLEMPRYFSETGFWVQGPFRRFWETHGGLFIFGYPITGVFKQDGYWRQYFERAVFEYHPESAGTEDEVQLVRVGAWRVSGREDEEPFRPIEWFPDTRDRRYFPETRHSLAFGFKAYWDRYGGWRVFGLPLSEEFSEQNPPPPAGDGAVHTVQYFERARFEYHPEYAGTPYEVLLGLLGREYLAVRGAPQEALARQDPALPPYDPIRNRQYGPHVGYGFNIAWRGDHDGDGFNQRTMDLVKGAGFSWIRFQAIWRDIETRPGRYDTHALDRIIGTAAANGVKIVVSVVGPPPTWVDPNGMMPADPSSYGKLMEFLAKRYAGKVHAWEIWNEQNLAYETGGHVDVGRYVNLLKVAYQGIKKSDPRAIVLFGGLTPTGVMDPSIAIDDVEYLRMVYAYNNGEVKQYFDHLATHPGGTLNPPDTLWPDRPGPGPGWLDHPSFYFRRAEQLRQVMVENGDAAKQVWLTEFGWSTANQAPGYEYGNYISEQQQAQYLVRAFEIARTEWPWVGVMLVWNLNFSTITDPSDEKFPWSVVYTDWSPRPAYRALQEMPK
ncbi:cellulase family glycosylhydrolase [Thermomicrobium sp. 4228-Ro]|uniref:cellulase family glycosylhydrolase n=1 Tax=Thermomicrobium sp. 4228-Ro TaxID=2993937 RepID=UPI002248B027|nr:cellulase family glycosylhydrolase [Thermomicrobium sp. 4228-Ro]MCX2726262.1 cellulase family glycosylhydrolase [Thermomicrobium sp. 4228-Ro]